MSKPVLCDVDDLLCEEQITDLLLPLLEQRPDILVYAYAIPNRLGSVHELRGRYPWLHLCIHGWEHTHGECLAWTEQHAKNLIGQAIDMGYEKIFKAPNWLCDEDTERACRDLGVILHHHDEYVPQTSGLRVYPGKPAYVACRPPHLNVHTHLVRNENTDFIADHPGFRDLSHLGEFLHLEELAVRVP